ncbi:oxidoreductase [Ophiocordyceps sinensis CO18]|uniref:Oxidoreductase n=1 Tax=Ophiocordyceps sinensis (strain Co18 / CGMCC 3.14243) TaxID=911162 RepID=T5AAC7_OPHSC|nr:oxidoreductase [Ophiocordyceps sinensis CO18]
MAPVDSNSGDHVVPYAAYLKQVMQQGPAPPPAVTTNPNLLEAMARDVMPKNGFDYIRGGAGESATMDANRLAFRQWKLVPRVLTPTDPRDLSVTLFGKKYNSPLLMAPVGVQSLYHDDKEVGTANACAALGVPFTLSTASSTGIEELIEKSPNGPKWFQLYWPTDEDLTASLLSRAKANGYQVLVVTLDTWTLGWRPQDIDTGNLPFLLGEGDEVGFQDPVFRKKFAERSDGETPESNTISAAAYWISLCFPDVSRGWEHLKLLRERWDGPIVLKGIMCVEDAELAVQHGIDGVIVSNHGGRQLDGAVATLDVLPEIADAVGGKITVMLDSGIRTGADIAKALALGAKAVFVGRPVVYGLGINGTAGAQAVLAGLLADLDLSMGFAGIKSISDLQPCRLRRVQHAGDVRSNM